jgi:DNA end-binding protein Ku
MRFAHEIRSPAELDLPGVRQGWTDKEMKLARQLMDTLSDEWDPKAFRDTYTEVLRQAIEAKVEGKEVVAPEMPKRPRVVSLMKALEQSLKERPLAKAEGRKTTARKRSAAGRRKAA